MPFDTDIVTTSPVGTDIVTTPPEAPVQTQPEVSPQLAASLRLLLEGDFQARWEATKRLPILGKAAIAHLVPLVEDEDLDWEVRWFAARTLGNFNDSEALESLVHLLQKTHEPELITIAAEGLSQFGAEGVSALMQLAAQPEHRLTAIQALASIRHKAVLPPLLAAAQDGHPLVRSTALAAIGHFRAPEVDPALLAAVNDPVAAVRQEAITHLGLRSHLLATIDLVELLFPSLWDLDPQVHQATAIALGRLGTATAIAHLSQVLRSPHTPESLQRVVVRALGWSNQVAALEALLAARQTVTEPVQIEIIETLARFEATHLRQQAGIALCEWLQTLFTHPAMSAVKQAVALALGNLHPPQAESLLQTLAQDADPQTSLYAEAALRQLAEPERSQQ